MTEVRRHKRQTASGRTVSVRQHTRDTGDGGDRLRPVREERAPYAGDLAPAATAAAPAGDIWDSDAAEPEGDFWADDAPETPGFAAMADEMRAWRSLPEPQPGPEEPMSPQMSRAMGCDAPEGRAKYDRLRAYRQAGYAGPLDQDSRIPDPDDPANHQVLGALAGLREISSG